MSRADLAMQRAREATATAFGGRAGGRPAGHDRHDDQRRRPAACPRPAGIPGIERFGAMRLAELDRDRAAAAPDDVADRPRASWASATAS